VKIQCAIYRGGTSKPIFFLENDLPKDARKERSSRARSIWHTTKSPGVPKIAVVAPPAPYSTPKGQVEASQIDVVARMTALQKLHKAYAVTGAVCLGTAAKIDGTIVNEIYRRVQADNPPAVRIGSPDRDNSSGN